MSIDRSRWDPVTGLLVAMATLPMSWVVGLEQFVPPLTLIVWAGAFIVTRPPVIRPEARLFAAFFVLTWGSATALDGSAEWGSWARGALTLAAGMAALVLASSIDVDGGDLARLGQAAVALLVGLGVLAALVSLHAIPLSFRGPLAPVFEGLPGWARSGFVGSRIVTRELGMEVNERGATMSAVWFGWPRFSGVFLIHGYAATAVLVLQVWAVLALLQRSMRRVFPVVAVLSGGFVLVAAGSRTALLLSALLLAAAAGVALLSHARALSAKSGAVAMGAITLVLVAPLPGGSILRRAFIEYRPNSFRRRTASYERSLELIADRPIFGWGVVGRAVEGLGLAPGSHSDPLNIVYRFGVIAGAMYLLVWVVLAVAAGRSLQSAWRRDRLATALPLAVVAIGGVALWVHSLFHSLTPDANVYWMCTALAGTIRAVVSAPSSSATLPTALVGDPP